MRPPLVIGVAGGSGSGKSTVVREIVRDVSPEAVSPVHHDAYYRNFDHLSAEERGEINFDHHNGILVLAEPDVRVLRRLRRDMKDRGRSLDSVLNQYEKTVRPMHREFVEPSKRWADIIIPEGGHNRVAGEMLLTKMPSILAQT